LEVHHVLSAIQVQGLPDDNEPNDLNSCFDKRKVYHLYRQRLTCTSGAHCRDNETLPRQVTVSWRVLGLERCKVDLQLKAAPRRLSQP